MTKIASALFQLRAAVKQLNASEINQHNVALNSASLVLVTGNCAKYRVFHAYPDQ